MTLDFRVSEPQTYFDPWRQRERTCRYVGRCRHCGVRCYEHDDGEDDPRGPLGDHSTAPLCASDYGMVGEDYLLCFPCGDDGGIYEDAVAEARTEWVLPQNSEGE